MRQVLVRVGNLLSKRWIWASVVAGAAVGSALVLAPLFGIPGYELGSAMALVIGLLGGAFGMSAAWDAGALPRTSPAATVFSALGASLLLDVLVLAPPFVASLLFSWTSTRCDPLSAIYFYPVLTLPPALMASAVGLACGWIARRRRWALLLYLILVLASAVKTIWPLFYGPQTYAYNHFTGYLPGPLYDELLTVRPGLLWHQLETLLIAAWMVLGCWWLLDLKTFRLARPPWRLLPLSGFALALMGIVQIELDAPRLGTRMNDGFVRAQLGGFARSEHFELIYPEGKPADEVSRWVRDLEFRYAQLRSFFGGAPRQTIRVYLYRTPEQKQALVGAAQTQFAKPWRYEIHLNDATFPHPTLKHELAHVMAAPFGAGPLRVTTKLGVWPVMGVIEGTAVAADNPVQQFTLHEWAAAMRRKKLAPDVRSLFRVRSFYSNPGPRAYTVAGSFIRYLNDTYGTEKLELLYRHGDFESAYHQSLDSLARGWEHLVDALPLDSQAMEEAFARFRRPSLFARPCAREVARLAEQAAALLPRNPAESLRLYRRCASIEPNEPSFQLGVASALESLGRTDEVIAVLTPLEAKLQSEPAVLAEVLMALADSFWRKGELQLAQATFQKVIQFKASPATDRAAYIKLNALQSPATEPAFRTYFQPGSEELKLFLLREAWEREPRNPYLNYLLGRRLEQFGAPTIANSFLANALAADLPASIQRESWRLKIESDYLAGDCAAVQTDGGALPDLDTAFMVEVSEWNDRCAFEAAYFHGPLVPEQAFR